MKRNYTLQCIIGYAAVTLCIGAILFFALRTSYENEQAQRREIEAEWIAEQKAYEAEVRAEKERWEVIEAINMVQPNVHKDHTLTSQIRNLRIYNTSNSNLRQD